jgi:hypothetical protein
MLMGFPLDYWDNETIQNSIASFGRMLLWENDRSHLTRLLVKARVSDLHDVPHFILLTEGEGFMGQSWTIQCEILEQELLGAVSADEDQHIWRFDASGSYSAKSAYRAFSTDLSLLSRGGRYGSVRHLVNAIFSSGLPFKAATGRLIALLAEECHVWRSAPFVIKRKRRLSTSSLDVSSQDRYGLLFCCLWRSEEQHHATMNDHSHSGGVKLLARLRSAKKE